MPIKQAEVNDPTNVQKFGVYSNILKVGVYISKFDLAFFYFKHSLNSTGGERACPETASTANLANIINKKYIATGKQFTGVLSLKIA